jgi:hypothetical protein
MFRAITIATALSFILCGTGSADAAGKYCASFVGGKEKAASRSTCHFASMQACRDAVRNRGGGHCYRMAKLR